MCIRDRYKNTWMRKLDKRPFFLKIILRIWPQNRDPGLKLESSILTRRGAPAGTCPGAFRTAMCWDPWFLIFTKIYIICGYNRNFPIPELEKKFGVGIFSCIIWSEKQDLGLKLAAAVLTRRGASIGAHFVTKKPHICRKRGLGFWGWGPPFPLMVLLN